jgi:hypothetical protein
MTLQNLSPRRTSTERRVPNGDGKPDVVTSNLESDRVTVLLAQ